MPLPVPPQSVDWTKVEAIVFDLGNVILDLDNDAYESSWPASFPEAKADFMNWQSEQRLFYRYDTGQLSSEEFVASLTGHLGLSPKQVITYWNLILLPGIKERRYKTLAALKDKYTLYVLSNTNAIHIDWVREHVAKAGFADFEKRYFQDVYYSHELHALKPEAAIYERAEQRMNRPVSGLLFIDDKLENVQAAQERGWQAIYLKPGRPVEEVLAPIL